MWRSDTYDKHRIAWAIARIAKLAYRISSTDLHLKIEIFTLS